MIKMIAKEKNDIEKILDNSFSEAHLDIRDELENKIFLMKDCDLGVMFEIEPIYDEIYLPEEFYEELFGIQKALRNVIPGVPSFKSQGNTTVQMILRSRRVRKAPQKRLNGRDFHFSSSTIGKFLKAEEDYLFSALNIVERKVFITVRYTHNPDDRSLKDRAYDFFKKKEFLSFLRSQISLEESLSDLDQGIATFVKVSKEIEDLLSLRGKVRRIGYEELSYYLQDSINSNIFQSLFAESENIHQSINCPSIVPTPTGIKNGKGFSDVYHLNQLPQSYGYGVFRSFVDAIPCCDFDLVWAMSRGSSKPRNEINARISHFDGKKSKVDIVDDFRSFKKGVTTFNPYGVQSIILVLHNPESGYETKLQNAANDYLYTHIINERQIPVHMTVSSLPLNANRFTNGLKGRSRKILLDKALAFMPLYGGPKSQDGVSWKLSRSGTCVQYNLFSGEGCKHACILGLTRVGKSSLTNSILDDFLEYNSQTLIRGIDVDTSYEKFSDLIGGEIVLFSEEHLKKHPHSPFSLNSWDEQDLSNLWFLIKMTILSKNPYVSWEGVHDNILLNAIKNAYNVHRENKIRKEKGLITGEIAPHPVWENIVSQFSETKIEIEKSGVGDIDAVVSDLNKWAISLTESGEYGFIFSAHQRHDIGAQKNRFLVYDLKGISDPTLRKVASMMASIKIMRDFDGVSRSVQKLFVIDELGQQIRSEQSNDGSKALEVMGGFIVNLAATAARKNVQLLAITNQVSDYTDNPVGQALWRLSGTHIFLPMGSLFEAAKEAWEKSFSEAEWEIIKSLKLDKQNRRSMVYIRQINDKSSFQGSLFLPLSPYMDAKNSSSGPQVELYRRLIREGYSPIDAIGYMAESHPYGEGLEIDLRDQKVQREMKSEDTQ